MYLLSGVRHLPTVARVMKSVSPLSRRIAAPDNGRGAVALVLAGGNGTRLGGLTQWVCKPALPFAGAFRNIDFSLSNCVHSGIRRVAVLTQYKSQELIRHLESAWAFLPRSLGEFVEIWPAQRRIQDDWYTGTANAVYQNLDMLRALAPRHVLVLAGDHVYQMDYRTLLAQHTASGASVTVACVPVPRSEAGGFGVLSVDASNHIADFIEKPLPGQLPPGGDTVLASMGIYVFDADYLYARLAEDAGQQGSAHDFGRDLVPGAVAAGDAAAFPFVNPRTGEPGYWRDVGTIASYWRAHMDLLDPAVDFTVSDPAWPIIAQTPQLGPAQFRHTTAPAVLNRALICDGCIIEGSSITSSVIGPAARIGDGCVIEESVVLPGAVIGPGCHLQRAIVSGDVRLAPGTSVRHEQQPDAGLAFREAGGAVLVTADGPTRRSRLLT